MHKSQLQQSGKVPEYHGVLPPAAEGVGTQHPWLAPFHGSVQGGLPAEHSGQTLAGDPAEEHCWALELTLCKGGS